MTFWSKATVLWGKLNLDQTPVITEVEKTPVFMKNPGYIPQIGKSNKQVTVTLNFDDSN